MLAASNGNTPFSARKYVKNVLPALFLSLINKDGGELLRVPLSNKEPTLLGSAKNCAVVLNKQSLAPVQASIELAKDGKTAIFKDVAAGKPSTFLKAGDEFTLGGKTFRVEVDENSRPPRTQGVKSATTNKQSVKFANDSTVALLPNGCFEVSTPSSAAKPAERKLTANQLRNSTPHVSKLGLGQLPVDEDEVQSRPSMQTTSSSVTRHAPSSAGRPMTSVQKQILSEAGKQARQAERLLAAEKQIRVPLLDISSVSQMYVPRDTIPASVRKFMAARAKKPATKALRPFPEQETTSKEPSPLKVEIQKEGLRLMARRTGLLQRLSDYELEPEAYESWTVTELEQRVWALEEEERRGAAEAILVESGHDPKDFMEYTADEIEDWLEREVIRKTAEIRSDQVSSSYRGTRMSFGSPIPSEPSFAVFEDEPAESEAPAPMAVMDESIPQPGDENVGVISETIASPIVAPMLGVSTTVKVIIPKPDPFEMTCEEIRSELRTRGLKVSGLKSVIAERLAQAFALEVEEEEFLTQGHEFIGKQVLREFESGPSKGRVDAFLPAVDHDVNSARFHIVHEDGDTEVLDYEETKLAIEVA